MHKLLAASLAGVGILGMSACGLTDAGVNAVNGINPSTSTSAKASASASPKPDPNLLKNCTVTHLDFIFDNSRFVYGPAAYAASPTCGTRQLDLNVYGQVLLNRTYDFRLNGDGIIVQVTPK